MLERSGILKIASVGDCGLRIIRHGYNFYSYLLEHFMALIILPFIFCDMKIRGLVALLNRSGNFFLFSSRTLF